MFRTAAAPERSGDGGRHRVNRAAAWALVLALAGSVAAAAGEQPRCGDFRANPAASIVDCDRVLSAGGLTARHEGLAHIGRASAYAALGQYAAAERDFERGIALYPAYAHAFSNRGAMYLDLGDHARALADLDHAIALDPRTHHAYINRASVHYELGDYEAAIADYTREIELNPKYALPYIGRGGARTYTGEPELAIADIDKARELGLETAWGYNARGNAHRLLGDLEPAERDYARALELDPVKVDAHLNMGDMRFFAGDLDAALDSYETAAVLNADDPADTATAHARRAEVLKKLGRTEEALAAFEASFEAGGADQIVAAQEYLAGAGHYDGPANGVYGPQLKQAVTACLGDPEC
jgi:tetratricopeptide (TPR) repeat protein